jgi:3-dehydroquinate synthase
MEVEKISVELGERSYEVLVGASLLGRADRLLTDLLLSRGWKRVSLITDKNVGPRYSGTVAGSLSRADLEVTVASVEAGEKSKNGRTAMALVDFMARSLLARSDLVVALGGGVVGDLAGFAASVYKRGIDVLHVPTTLMAQVDSSIGGKTGVNLEHGKNLVGTFHQPVAVLCDVEVLATLAPREYASGLAEVAKYSFLMPDVFSPSIESRGEFIRDPRHPQIAQVVMTCAWIKSQVVAADERDKGPRVVLNYGHTLGHALEAAAEYEGSCTHGEAVSIGMVFAAQVAEKLGVASSGLAERHRRVLRKMGLPVRPAGPAPDFDKVAGHLAQDKKSKGDLTMVLLEEEGSPVVRGDIDLDVLAGCYARLLEAG